MINGLLEGFFFETSLFDSFRGFGGHGKHKREREKDEQLWPKNRVKRSENKNYMYWPFIKRNEIKRFKKF